MGLLRVLTGLAPLAAALRPQPDTFNSTFRLSEAQLAPLNLTAADAADIEVVVRFERSNWATGSVLTDPFYTSLPANASDAAPGAVLKVEAFTNTTPYTIAPALALSRFVYQSVSVNGTRVPVSAFILWPYEPRVRRGAAAVDDRRAPLVAWGHGTSGVDAECAPSHIRNLWYQFTAPYTLALAGFAVVGTDYAGLGVSKNANGATIEHEYLGLSAQGNDILYSAQAAQAAFPGELTGDFVVMGHSQGGGAAWAAAQQQLRAKIPGYLGSIAVAPVTNLIELSSKDIAHSVRLVRAAKAIMYAIKGVSLADILTDTAFKFLDLILGIQGCSSASSVALAKVRAANPRQALVRTDFFQTKAAKEFVNMTMPGGKDFADPLLVIHGAADRILSVNITEKYVIETCRRYPRRKFEYVRVPQQGHPSVLYATQQLWINWLDDRFAEDRGQQPLTANHGVSVTNNCTVREVGRSSPRPLSQYQDGMSYFLEFAQQKYQVA
ncbi:hypothetical protein HIM_08504 [Hirsutella minnesotensis 3608]|uniref:Serine aminopeptidase S33 domain-containing protein n=1 Tax=Hirsutella minnesotensis 3608 TaxID=1043627 RepID=A0A0F7ZH71_9HYPO|nr:hypothetical protein HIM_08504 [Hirsutella minnesotensis 3608]